MIATAPPPPRRRAPPFVISTTDGGTAFLTTSVTATAGTDTVWYSAPLPALPEPPSNRQARRRSAALDRRRKARP